MTIAGDSAETKDRPTDSPLEVLLVFLRLGVTCFGGPIAHIGYFRDEFVVRRRWVTIGKNLAPPSCCRRGRVEHVHHALELRRASRGTIIILTSNIGRLTINLAADLVQLV
jgi:hypothetical protein